ncbi:MAG: aspartyl/glutamyl-tRNA amidotransferase subunit C [Treponema sp.]|jgi:aspartyl-tRNA(Asn)/glutamyl-tRNA(Gln) amidotransferase subunit C|nr:aspartyl/glutamyl-tRNA amidotransferase subunit C [Treponema sp.]
MNIADLQETAALAHITMDDEELAAAFPAFEQMVGFFAAMRSADEDSAAFSTPISRVSGTSRTVSSDHFRPDNPDCSDNSFNDLNENLLTARDGRFVVIPNIL